MDFAGLHADEFQSTRPRGARPHEGGVPGAAHLVSIHAPTRGATMSRTRPRLMTEFQSTRPRGARRRLGLGHHHADHVSIHAPTRGATPPAPGSSPPRTGFNPRAHEGRDGATMPSGSWPRCFNPSAHEGRDYEGLLLLPLENRFQSTRPRGARRCGSRHRRSPARVSIHAPTRGATRRALGVAACRGVSIHAPTRGATR